METIQVDIKRGETIFKNLVEYPLPKKSGIKDYVFYFVSSKDDYGIGARAFLRKYYPNHIQKTSTSLEDLIDQLSSEITKRSLTQIRELVLVGHGNRNELKIQVVKGDLEKNKQEKASYQVTAAGSIRNLQIAFKKEEARFNAFKANRKAVVSKLLKDSWITIRACRFGQSSSGLYALYSFFGGKANVYAPTEYQFFASAMPIGEGLRIEGDIEFYEHLVKQGFIRRKKHSESRKNKIIKELVTPGKGKENFELASYSIGANKVLSGDKEFYDKIKNDLESKEISNEIKEMFSFQKLSLSDEDSFIVVKRKGERWEIFDEKLKIEEHHYKIRYKITVDYTRYFNEHDYAVRLLVTPIINHRKQLPKIPVQFFFSEDQNDTFKGRLFQLAAFTYEIENGNEIVKEPADKTLYDAYEAMLDAGVFQDGMGNNLISIFEANFEDDIGSNPTINKLPLNKGKKVWGIQGEANVKYKVEETYNYVIPTGIKKSLQVSYVITKKYQSDQLVYLGQDPDCPGTELYAYLDNFSREELLDLLYFLRESYVKENAFYIYQVQEALQRKHDNLQWFSTTEEWEKGIEQPLYFSPLVFLNDVEKEHKDLFAYHFTNIWSEVKASSSRQTTFDSDPFELVDLPFDPVQFTVVLDPDSPSQDSSLLDGETKPVPPPEFFEKEIVYEEEKKELTCEQFGEMLKEIKQFQIENPNILIEDLKEKFVLESKAGRGLYDYYKDLKWAFDFGSAVFIGIGPSALATRIFGLGLSRLLAINTLIGLGAAPLLHFFSVVGEVAQDAENLGIIHGVKFGSNILRDEYIRPFQAGKITVIPKKLQLSKSINEYEARYKKWYFSSGAAPNFSNSWDGCQVGLKRSLNIFNEALRKEDRYYADLLTYQGMDLCKAYKLIDSGLLDKNKLRWALIDGLSTTLNRKYYAEMNKKGYRKI